MRILCRTKLAILIFLAHWAYAPSASAASLEEYLLVNPAIASRIVWTNAKGKDIPYSRWSAAEKAELLHLFRLMEEGATDLGLDCGQAARFHDDQAAVFYKKQKAWRIYLAHVAHTLRLSARRIVPWSLTDLLPEELDQFLASRSYFSWIAKRDAQVPAEIRPGIDFASRPEENFSMAAICDPRDGLRFLTGENATESYSLLGASPKETVMKLSLFLRDNTVHGDPDELNDGKFLLRDRLKKSKDFPGITAYAGCHSAAKLLFDLARSVNIPLLLVAVHDNPSAFKPSEGSFLGHRGLVFDWARATPLVLWHADELYANGYMPVFLPPALRDEAFLRKTWLSPAELLQLGFTFQLRQQRNPFRSENVMRFPSLGIDLGKWRNDKAVRDFAISQEENLCSAGLLEKICKEGQSASPKARTCLENAGGCKAVLEVIDQYSADFGSKSKRVWR